MDHQTSTVMFLFLFAIVSFTSTWASTSSQEVIDANSLFTAAIYKQIVNEPHDNVLVSPFSLETVLAFAQAGAKGATAQEIRSGLHLPDEQQKIASAFETLTQTLKSAEDYFLSSANKIYVNSDLKLNDDFTKTSAQHFHSGMENADFSPSASRGTARKINDWVEGQTKHKIRNLVNSKSFTRDTSALLINALYFKGNFTEPFTTVQKKRFYNKNSNDASVLVDIMGNLNLFGYHECSDLKVKFLELPFEGKDVSLVIVLPNEKDGISVLENDLASLQKVFTHKLFTQEAVEVSLPKFKVESQLLLKQKLKNLGISKAFTEDADFSGIAGKPGDLYISDVLQKTFIAVDKDGVEAAAATLSLFSTRSEIDYLDVKTFNADHPFIFYLRIRGVVIFAGRVTKL